MRNRVLIVATALASLCVLVVMAVHAAGAGNNPPLDRAASIEAAMPIPPEISQFLDKACRDCHSNETRWPWYSKIPPASWMIWADVKKAREAMNLSEWSNQAGSTPTRAAGTLLAACGNAKSGRMPPAEYKLLHEESRVGASEIDTFCEWATLSSKRLLAQHTTKLEKQNVQ